MVLNYDENDELDNFIIHARGCYKPGVDWKDHECGNNDWYVVLEYLYYVRNLVNIANDLSEDNILIKNKGVYMNFEGLCLQVWLQVKEQ